MIEAEKLLVPDGPAEVVSLQVLDKAALAKSVPAVKRQAEAAGFEAAPLSLLMCHKADGTLPRILIGAPGPEADPFALGSIASKLPPGTYRFESEVTHATALAWALELYRFDPFRAGKAMPKLARLVLPKGMDRARAIAEANAHFLVRDLINAPANLLGPDELEAAARKLARAHGARFNITSGKRLAKEFPLIHAVGAASPRRPRLIDFTWGNPRHPKVTLVGKGVCFDTGGLDIKPSSGMLLMKKDMGGAATALGVAQLVMAAKLRLRLRVLIPAVENAIAGEAFRPGDVFKSRKGLTVEIGNTDAEGRLILADALALADEEVPDLLVDLATLTGAARVALGPDLPPFYTDDAALSSHLARHAAEQNDPLWPMPLWRPYAAMIESPVADLNNAGQGGFAGSITAALFLRRFVDRARAHVHFDIFGWVPAPKPGRPRGGEAQAMRALYAYLREAYAAR